MRKNKLIIACSFGNRKDAMKTSLVDKTSSFHYNKLQFRRLLWHFPHKSKEIEKR